MERKTEEDAVMTTWKMEVVDTEIKIGRPILRGRDIIRKLRHEGETSKDRRSIRPENKLWRMKTRCADTK